MSTFSIPMNLATGSIKSSFSTLQLQKVLIIDFLKKSLRFGNSLIRKLNHLVYISLQIAFNKY